MINILLEVILADANQRDPPPIIQRQTDGSPLLDDLFYSIMDAEYSESQPQEPPKKKQDPPQTKGVLPPDILKWVRDNLARGRYKFQSTGGVPNSFSYRRRKDYYC